MTNISQRIKEIAENEGLKLTQLEQKIGASKGVLTRSLNNNTDIQSKWLTLVVENYPNYNSEWILTGRGVMLKSDQPKAVENNDTCPICKEKDKRIEQLEHQIKRYENDIDWLKTQIDCQDETEPNTKRRSA
jgi:hypothetical protein